MTFDLLSTFNDYKTIEDAWGYNQKDSLETRSHGDTRYLQELTDIIFRPFSQMKKEVPFFETWNLLNKYANMNNLMFKYELERHQIDKGIELIHEYFKNVDIDMYKKLMAIELEPIPMFEGDTYNDKEYDLLVAHVIKQVANMLYAINDLQPGNNFTLIFENNTTLKEHHANLLVYINKVKSMSHEDDLMYGDY